MPNLINYEFTKVKRIFEEAFPWVYHRENLESTALGKNPSSHIRSTLKEKLCYAFGNMGSYILWAFTGAYVTVYVTNCLQPGKELIALTGTLILVCRIFDAFSDILMGILIEKTHSPIGKARFWFGISIIPLIIVFFFMYFVSGLSPVAAITTLLVFYFLFTVIFYTMNNIAFNALLPRISDDPYDQSNICTLDSVFTSVGGLVSGVAIPILGAFGGKDQQSSWTLFVALLCLFALLGQLVCFFGVKEKKEIVPLAKETTSKSDLKRGLKALFRTPYFYIAVAMFALNYYISLSVTNIGVYYATYILQKEVAYSLFGTVPMVTMGIGLLLTPVLVKKIGKKNTLSLAILFVVVGNIIGSIFYTSFWAGMVSVLIKGFGSAVVMSQLYTLAPDIVTYIEKKEGIRVEGLAASANSFGCKIGSGLGTAMALWALSWCSIDVNATTQSDLANYTLISLYWWVPCLLSVLLLFLSTRWDIAQKTAELSGKEGPR